MQESLSYVIKSTKGVVGAPLAATIDRLAADADDVRYVVGLPPDDGWVVLAEAIADETVIGQWLADIRDRNGGLEAVAASFLASWLAGVVVGPLTVAIIRERRAWSVAAPDLLVHRHEDGWFDGLAIRGARVVVLPGDPESRHPDAVVVDDLGALRSTVAAELASTLGLAFGAIRRQGHLGPPAMWGAMADAAGFAAVADATARGRDPATAFEEALALVDAVADFVRLPRVRPSLVQVPWSGGRGYEIARGTCCLWYRTQVDPDPAGEGFCDSCPRRDPDDQRRRWTASREMTPTCAP